MEPELRGAAIGVGNAMLPPQPVSSPLCLQAPGTWPVALVIPGLRLLTPVPSRAVLPRHLLRQTAAMLDEVLTASG